MCASVTARVARITSEASGPFVFVRVLQSFGGAPTDIIDLHRWLLTQPGYETCVLLAPDGKGGCAVLGPDSALSKEFQPFEKLPWKEVSISDARPESQVVGQMETPGWRSKQLSRYVNGAICSLAGFVFPIQSMMLIVIIIWFVLAYRAERFARNSARVLVGQASELSKVRWLVIRRVLWRVTWQLGILFGLILFSGESPGQRAIAIVGFIIAWILMFAVVVGGTLLELHRIQKLPVGPIKLVSAK